ncbi:MAG: O-antigen ligase family protein [Chloroflexota bacterium]
MGRRINQVALDVLWAVLILLLPVTSLPLLSRLVGGSMVAPAAAIPLSIIAAIFLPAYFLKGGGLPRQVLPIFAFVLVAAISTALSFFIEFPLFRDINRLRNALSGILTLAIGILFFLTAAVTLGNPQQIERFFRWINISGLISLVWAGGQTAVWFAQGEYPQWMWDIQGMISISGNLYVRRTTGFAFEPSWLGHQLVLFYLPYWLAASYNQRSAFGWRLWRISAENLLLAAGAGILFLSLSRSALVSFALALGLLTVRLTGRFVAWLHAKLNPQTSAAQKIKPRLILAAIWLVMLLAYGGILFSGVVAITQLDPRMEELFTVLRNPYNPLQAANYLFFGERVAFWSAGLGVFGEFPILGAGLENAGFFFPEKLPISAWGIIEPHKMYYSAALPNTLSLWVRLLAETGIIGFGLFFSFLFLMWKTTAAMLNHLQPAIATLALTTQLTLTALLMEGMSVDTFAFPYFWLILGWACAAYRMTRAVTVSSSAHGAEGGLGNGHTNSVAGSRQ